MSQNLILAGTEATSTTLTWILCLLLNNRDVLKLAKEELDLQVCRERWVKDTDIKSLIYLQAIVKETLRLYRSAPLSVQHEAMEDCQVSDFHIPKGTRLFVNLWKLYRDPTVWLDPKVFSTYRFLTTQASIDASGFELAPDMPMDMTEGLGIARRKATYSLEVMLIPRLPSQFYEG
ncbi:hypothetical protein PS2_035203 [Malus domestica]